jgi:uncharacterized protein (PEP-CTERM system associated)
MVIMAMAMAKKINKYNIIKYATLVFLVLFSSMSFARDWTFTPSLKLEETFSDNIELTTFEPKSSFITQTIAGINTTYDSGANNFNFLASKRYTLYSHNSQLNSDYQNLTANGLYSLWSSGLAIIANASIANVNINNANNNLADAISGDTVETKNYSTGLQYNFSSSSYSVLSSMMYNTNRAEDSIGESEGYTARLSSKNGNNARHVYWQFNSNYTRREQDLGNNISNFGENYSINAQIGAITSWKINPFIRFYDEEVKGTGVTQDLQSNASWGAGVRWLASPHIIIDISYNLVPDETISDNYIAASVQWQPSSRTSLTADYSQRFFGKAYNLNFRHKSRRLTNNITYNEALRVFDRNSYQAGDGIELELVESNEYSLNRTIAWSSNLQLSRTSFNFNVSANERESLQITNIIDNTVKIGLTVTRKVSGSSSVSFGGNFNNTIFDKDNPEGSRQNDYYRTISASFNKSLASSLSTNFTIRHVNRSSSNAQYSYEELRATINITKEF